MESELPTGAAQISPSTEFQVEQPLAIQRADAAPEPPGSLAELIAGK
jgi:hypothetical protein